MIRHTICLVVFICISFFSNAQNDTTNTRNGLYIGGGVRTMSLNGDLYYPYTEYPALSKSLYYKNSIIDKGEKGFGIRPLIVLTYFIRNINLRAFTSYYNHSYIINWNESYFDDLEFNFSVNRNFSILKIKNIFLYTGSQFKYSSENIDFFMIGDQAGQGYLANMRSRLFGWYVPIGLFYDFNKLVVSVDCELSFYAFIKGYSLHRGRYNYKYSLIDFNVLSKHQNVKDFIHDKLFFNLINLTLIYKIHK